jgi:guanylate kinase
VLAQEHSAYIARHPELVQLLQDLMTSALLHKPNDSFEFATKFVSDVQGKFYVSQEQAAVKIQSIGRMKRDKARVQGIKHSKVHQLPPKPEKAKVLKVPLVVAGAAGTGKSTVLARLGAKYPHLLKLVVAHTSRQPQPHEDDGKDFVFVDEAQMNQMTQAGAFAVSWSSEGQLYGVQRALVDDVLRMNRVPLLKLSARSLVQLTKALAPAKVLSVYFSPPPLAELAERLQKSGKLSAAQVEEALRDAEADAALLEAEPVCDHLLPSGRPEDCFLQVEKLALEAAGAKTVEHFTAEDEKRIVLMQTIARGKRDKKRVDSIRQQRQVGGLCLFMRLLVCFFLALCCCSRAVQASMAEAAEAAAADGDAPPAASGEN